MDDGSTPSTSTNTLLKTMSKINWVKTESTFRRMEGELSTYSQLPKGVYEIGLSRDGWYLTKTADRFVFNYKLYNLETQFVEYALKTYNNTTGNLGILFNGTRGTGKTVTAKVLANELNLPVIIVKSFGDDNSMLVSFLSSFNFDCVLFFDEFEKQFNDKDSSILQIMDGIYSSGYRTVFLLTTNELYVNENLLTRPSRIRYVKQFGNLSNEIIEEYLKDNLKDMSAKEELMSYIDTLTISTIDILKAIVEEINIHGIESFLETKKVFNVQTATYSYRTTRAYINVAENKKCAEYNIDNFVEELKRRENRYEIDSEFRKSYDNAKSEEEKAKILTEFKPLRSYTGNFTFEYVDDEEKPWNKLIPGDYFNNQLVVKVDEARHVVVCRYDSYLYFYYIENPDQKPSLYKNKDKASAYAYL